MPTIDQLSPATSASDTDEFPVSQAGITRSVTRAQVLNGVQPAISLSSGSLLGRISTGIGAPEVIAVGSNLLLSSGTLSASAVPFVIGALPEGNVPASGDLLSMSQSGTNVAVTVWPTAERHIRRRKHRPLARAGHDHRCGGGRNLGQSGCEHAAPRRRNADWLVSTLRQSDIVCPGSQQGLRRSADLDRPASDRRVDERNANLGGASAAPAGLVTKGYADAIAAGSLQLGGGSLSGSLLLNANPSVALQAATKTYADLKLSRSGDTLTGVLALAADPVTPPQAATKNYVDTQSGAALPMAGGTMLGSLVLASDPTANAQAATKQYVDQHVLRAGDTLTGALILASDPFVAGQASTKHYVDTNFAGAVSLTGSSMSGALLLASDPAVALQASTKQYVDLHVVRSGDTLTGALYLASNPTSPLQAATKQYVDGQLSTGVSAGGGTFTGPVTLAGDPTLPLQAATKQYADTKVLRAGDTLTGALTLAANPVAPLQAATKGYVDTQVLGSLPLSGGSLTGTLSLAADPVSAGQAATKHYVDSQVATAVPLAGGSLTGFLSLAANPTATAHAANKQYVDGRIATTLPLTGGSLTGILTLSAAPTLPLQAATKSYVDANPNSEGVINVALAPYGAKLNGVTDDTAAFSAAYQAAPAGSAIYVPNGTTVLQQPGNWGIALTKRVKWIIDGTTLADGTPLASSVPTGGAPAELVLPGFVGGNTPTGLSSSQGSSTTPDFAVNQSSYIVNHNGGHERLRYHQHQSRHDHLQQPRKLRLGWP